MAEHEDHIDFRISELIAKHLKHEISENEALELNRWRASDKQNEALWIKLTRPEYLSDRLRTWDDPASSERIYGRIEEHIQVAESSRRRFPIFRIAAGLAAVLLIGLWLYRLKQDATHPEHYLTDLGITQPIDSPARLPSVFDEGIMLTLADGSRVPLDKNIQRTEHGSTLKGNAQELTYATGSRNISYAAVNRVTTPKGLTYSLKLADGTTVWLSSQTSIRFPVAFPGNERVVELDGEAYFEVYPDKKRPFLVKTSKSNVTVLGTSFNVQAYPDEHADRTSLVEGSVKVSDAAGRAAKTITPGYEVTVDQSASLTVSQANLEKALAWKNGLFVFDNESLETLTENLSRWYNVRFQFAKNTYRGYRFSARLKRTSTVEEVLDLIAETAKVKFVKSADGVILVGAP